VKVPEVDLLIVRSNRFAYHLRFQKRPLAARWRDVIMPFNMSLLLRPLGLFRWMAEKWTAYEEKMVWMSSCIHFHIFRHSRVIKSSEKAIPSIQYIYNSALRTQIENAIFVLIVN